MRATGIATLTLIGLIAGIGSPSPSHAQSVCPAPAAKALETAQKILKDDDRERFDVALACLTIALAATRREIDDLREGRTAFSGQIYAPKGFVMTKPPVQEGR